MTLLSMEEHHEAYFAWKREGLKDQWCWHVDAHLDIGKTGLSEDRLDRLIPCETSQEAREAGLMGNSYLPWGGLHCGNYLFPAIREGIVSRLTWIIPPDLPEGPLATWGPRHLNGWFELELGEYASLKEEDGRLAGTLLGIPFEMGTLESLGLPTEPVLLDIDIDYFLTENGDPWTDPAHFREAIASVTSLYTTVAYSVKGGFTPTGQRVLAEPFVPTGAAGYTSSPLDDMAFKVRCHRYREAMEQEWSGPMPVEVFFLRGTSLQGLEKHSEALELWEELLNNPTLPEDGVTYLHGLCAELHNDAGTWDSALTHALKAQKIDPRDYRHHFNEAIAREQMGDMRKAVKALRQTVRLSEHLLFGLRARYALSRVYAHQGKKGLARIELQKLAQLDVTGNYRPVTMLNPQ